MVTGRSPTRAAGDVPRSGLRRGMVSSFERPPSGVFDRYEEVVVHGRARNFLESDCLGRGPQHKVDVNGVMGKLHTTVVRALYSRPAFIRTCTSLGTARTSRMTRRAISRIAIGPCPARARRAARPANWRRHRSRASNRPTESLLRRALGTRIARGICNAQ